MLGTGPRKYYLRKWRSQTLVEHVARHHGVLSGGEKEKGGCIPGVLRFADGTGCRRNFWERERIIEKFTKTHGP